LIATEALRREFGAGAAKVVALHDVDLQVREGEFVAVAGPSGSGKTSLLNLIGAIDRPTSGRVCVGGHDLASLDENRLAEFRLRSVGLIFQQFNLIPVLTAAENVEMPLLFHAGLARKERMTRVTEQLERVGLADKAGRRPSELSGGEQQRVAIARALAGRPSIVLADEPTANLDHATGDAVIRLMHRLNRDHGTTFLYATHDSELIALADRVVRLRDGRLVEAGR
jgi:putative ABC transport system ATP-binding protein